MAKPEPKTVTIIVNGTPQEVAKGDLTYVEVVTFAFADYPSNTQLTYSVTYERGEGHKPEGILSPGGLVKAKEGMIFSVSRTGQS
jgi:hypothetical protein